MLKDAGEVPDGSLLRTGVCIIGAGAAGITLARELEGRGIDVLVLESGGLAPSAENQRLYAGVAAGALEPFPDYSIDSRLRYFGGSTNHWGGQCRPFEEHDFDAREWIPASGWPLTVADLVPHYIRAAAICQIPAFHGPEALDMAIFREQFRDTDSLAARLFHYSPPTRFGEVYRQELIGSAKTTILLNANCVSIDAAEGGRSIRELKVRGPGGRHLTVEARQFVLACGGLENARLLLNSDGAAASGLGNERDQVGRYFMEHPSVYAGRFVLWPTPHELRQGIFDVYRGLVTPDGVRLKPSIQTTNVFQKRARTAAVAFFLLPDDPAPQQEEVLSTGYRIDADLMTRSLPSKVGQTFHGRIWADFEATPNPESRVTLTGERDVLGLLRIRVDWVRNPLDYRSLDRSVRELGRVLHSKSKGRIRVDFDPENPEGQPIGYNNHHMGTTRMGVDPATSVVDRDCRVHGIENLYVAGSSVFPTSGVANPTLTIVALALRMAAHLR